MNNRNKKPDLSKLSVGMVIDSFADLCALVGFQFDGGGRQRTQITKKLQQYIEWEHPMNEETGRPRRKIIITRIKQAS